MKTAKLTTVRFTLIVLQLVSLTIATVIIIVHYNPWIERLIDEAGRTTTTSQSLVEQIRRVEGEEIVIFFMSLTTIIVSLLGIIGTLRGHEHNHCLLNFYMSTLIIFLFVIFVALCGTIWEMISKLHHSSSLATTSPVAHLSSSSIQSTPPSNLFDSANRPTSGQPFDSTYLVDDFDLAPVPLNRTQPNEIGWPVLRSTSTSYPALPELPVTSTNSAQTPVTWWYIGKSFIFISLSAALYATSLKLTRRILELSDDRYLSANDDIDDDDLNSEGSSTGIHYTATNVRLPYHFHYPGNIAGIYNPNMINSCKPPAIGVMMGKHGTNMIGSHFRNIL